MVLGDGAPGMADDDYFHSPSKLDGVNDELPEALLDKINRRGVEIKLHTLCVGRFCTTPVARLHFLLRSGPVISRYYSASGIIGYACSVRQKSWLSGRPT